MTARPAKALRAANDNQRCTGFAPLCVAPARLQEAFASHYAPEGFREQVLLLTRGRREVRPSHTGALRASRPPSSLDAPARVCVA